MLTGECKQCNCTCWSLTTAEQRDSGQEKAIIKMYPEVKYQSHKPED